MILCIIGLLIAMFAISIFAGPPWKRSVAQRPPPIDRNCMCSPLRPRDRLADPNPFAHGATHARICEGCGELIAAKPPSPRICPNCRNRKLSHDQVKKEQTRTNRTFDDTWSIRRSHRTPFLVISALNTLTVDTRDAVFRRSDHGCSFDVIWLLARTLIQSRRVSSLLGEEERCRGRKSRRRRGRNRHKGWPEDDLVFRPGRSHAHAARGILQQHTLASPNVLGESDISDPALLILCFHDRAALSGFTGPCSPASMSPSSSASTCSRPGMS